LNLFVLSVLEAKKEETAAQLSRHLAVPLTLAIETVQFRVKRTGTHESPSKPQIWHFGICNYVPCHHQLENNFLVLKNAAGASVPVELFFPVCCAA
jgi:hypothetical protein